MLIKAIMTIRDRLKGSFSEGDAMDIYQQVKANGDFAGFCRQFMHDEDRQVVRKALWGLTKASRTEITQLQPLQDNLTDLAMTTADPAVRRLSLSILSRLQMRKENLRTDFLDFCLSHMTDTQEYPAIQSLCMKLAFSMCSFFPELMDELMRTAEAMDMAYYTPAVKSVRNKILRSSSAVSPL